MTNIKRIALCEHITHTFVSSPVMPRWDWLCRKPAKYLRDFPDPKAKPQHLCGIHANMLKKRGIKVRVI